jgi:hypothetical protein
MTTAGGGYIVGSNWQTLGVTTTTVTPNKKNQALGAQTGGPGFWMAANPDMAVQVQNGQSTTAGYLDFSGASASATENLEGFFEWSEA